MSGLRYGSLFSGCLGLDMGVQSVLGGTTAWVSDIDKGACKILAHRAPDVPNIGDISAVDWSQVEPVDVLTGGFPCQDVSSAGKRAGIRPGTRSGLWSQFAYAISQLQPRLVVIENVRGLLSASAHSDLEPCPWCVGDRPDGHLRALGAVLGDLADLGYDASWYGLRAADVGAPHGRYRVFIAAFPADQRHERPRVTRDGWAGSAHGDRESVITLPTTTARDWKNVGDPAKTAGRMAKRGQPLGEVVVNALLPTPAVNDMGEGKTPEHWDEWTAKMQAAHGNGNGHGKSLAIEAQRLLPTPRASDGPDATSHGRSWSTPDNNLHTVVKRGEISNGLPTEGRSGEELPDLRGGADTQEVRERSSGGPDGVPQEELLLTELREHADGGREGHAALARKEAQGADLPGLRNDGTAARTPRGPEPGEQRSVEPDDALRQLSSQVALAGGSGGVDWGPYAAAIHRWEVVLGRQAPPPTILSAKGNPQLSAVFVEFLMGLPAGWVTDAPGITRNEALKALGNGVVPAQAAAAVLHMLGSQSLAAPPRVGELLPTPRVTQAGYADDGRGGKSLDVKARRLGAGGAT